MKHTDEKKVVVITGSSSGFGFLTAKALLEKGHTVVATMRDPQTRAAPAVKELRNLAKKTGAHLSVLEMDVTSDASVESAIGDAVKEHGRVDVLVNNAGFMLVGVTEAFSMEELKSQFETNTFGPARVARAVLPHMRARKSGLLIQVTSIAGRLVFPFFGIYSASKFAAEALAESYHYELSNLGIESVIVEPGPFPSDLLPRSPAPSDDGRTQAYGDVGQIPQAMRESFQALYDGPDAPDANDVAMAIVGLIAQDTKRPLRTVVMPKGMDFGVDGLNQSTSVVQNALMKALQMETMI